MSNCAHRQSTYKLQEMPHCKKCRGELIYIMVKYINEKFFRWEWECVKCHKVYKEYSISLPELLEQDRELHERLKNENRRSNIRLVKNPK